MTSASVTKMRECSAAHCAVASQVVALPISVSATSQTFFLPPVRSLLPAGSSENGVKEPPHLSAGRSNNRVAQRATHAGNVRFETTTFRSQFVGLAKHARVSLSLALRLFLTKESRRPHRWQWHASRAPSSAMEHVGCGSRANGSRRQSFSPESQDSPGSPGSGSGSRSSRLRVVAAKFQPHRLLDRSGKTASKLDMTTALTKSVKAESARTKLARQKTLANASVDELMTQGFSKAQAEGVVISRKKPSSAPLRGVNAANDDMSQLAELKRVGFTLQELRDVGFSAAVLRTAGYSPQEVRDVIALIRTRAQHVNMVTESCPAHSRKQHPPILHLMSLSLPPSLRTLARSSKTQA